MSEVQAAEVTFPYPSYKEPKFHVNPLTLSPTTVTRIACLSTGCQAEALSSQYPLRIPVLYRGAYRYGMVIAMASSGW